MCCKLYGFAAPWHSQEVYKQLCPAHPNPCTFCLPFSELLLRCLLFVECLQTKKGKEASGMTADEFEDKMWELACVVEELKDVAGFGRSDHWKLSIDNDKSHAAARLDALGIWPKQFRVELAPLSPDAHKAVEHVHANLLSKHNSWRRSFWPEKPSPEQCITKLQELFQSYPVWSIQADIDSLPETYQAIIDAGGMYPTPDKR